MEQGAGTFSMPLIPPKPQNFLVSGGVGIGHNIGAGVLGTSANFNRSYSFDDAPGHLKPVLPMRQ